MKRGYLVLALIALLAVALAVPALGGSARTTAKTSASVKKTAKKALKKAENAQEAANAAQGSANAAQGVANAAQSSADAAQSSVDAITGASAYQDVCDPPDTNFLDCVGVTLTLSKSGRVLLNATGGQLTNAAGAFGDCRLEVDDSTAAIPHSTTNTPGESSDNTSSGATNGFANTAVTNVLPAGSHTFELSCSDDGGGQLIHDAMISAVRISG